MRYTFETSLILVLLCFMQRALASLQKGRTSPPPGSLVVRAGATQSTEYPNITSALNALPDDGSAQSIFVYPGTYAERLFITRTGALTIYGYTKDVSTYTCNEVIITASMSAQEAGSDDASGTVRIHTNDFNLYNVDIKNVYGPGTQAIAFSQYGSRVGLYASGFYGYQDTLYANVGTQVYLRGYIEGAVDFIFGRQGLAYFGGNTIGVIGPGCVTASGRELDDAGSYVLNKNKIVLGANAFANTTGNVFLGRPWGAFAKVIFKNTDIEAPLNKTFWSIWDPGDDRTSNVTLADWHSTGPGTRGAVRPSFVNILTSEEAANYSIASAVGSDYADWVDMEYFV